MATLRSDAITTVARLSSFLGISTPASGSTKETSLILQINALTQFIINYLGYSPKQQAYTHLMDSNGGDSIQLPVFPVVEGEAFALYLRDSGENEDEWSLIDTEEYFVENDTGIVFGAGRRKFNIGRKIYKATYTAGYDYDNSSTFLGDTDGADLELAGWMLGAEVYNRGKGGGGIQSEAIGDYKIVYKSAMFNNEEISTLLDNYVGGGGSSGTGGGVAIVGSPLTPYHY